MESLARLRNIFTRKVVLPATTVIMLAALVFGCSRKPDVVGTWENISTPELIEFKADNSGAIQGKNQPLLAFVWQETAPHTYNLDVNFLGQKKSLKAVVKDGSLVLEGSGGTETYKKRATK